MPLALSRLILLPSTIISGIEPVQLTDESQNTVGSIHRLTGWYVVGLLGLIGVWGLVFAIARRQPGRAFMIGFGLGVVAALVQVTLGVIAFSSGVDPGNQHVFYGVVLVFTLAFAYIYLSLIHI